MPRLNESENGTTTYVGGYGIANGKGKREHSVGIVISGRSYIKDDYKQICAEEIILRIKENTRLHGEKMTEQRKLKPQVIRNRIS